MKKIVIPDIDGSSEMALVIFQGDDGDLYISVTPANKTITFKHVEICHPQGSPRHRELHSLLLAVMKEAENLGYGVEN